MGSDEELPALHHLFVVEPDIKVAANAVDMGLGDPSLTGMLGIELASHIPLRRAPVDPA